MTNHHMEHVSHRTKDDKVIFWPFFPIMRKQHKLQNIVGEFYSSLRRSVLSLNEDILAVYVHVLLSYFTFQIIPMPIQIK